MKPGKQNGFTLIELMVAVAIVAILASIALPSYQAYVRRGNRGAAEGEMMDIASREQQFLLANRAYADWPTLTASGYVLPSNVSSKYTPAIALGTGALPTFVVTFTPIAGTIQASDGPLVLTSEGVKTRNGNPAQW